MIINEACRPLLELTSKLKKMRMKEREPVNVPGNLCELKDPST